MKALLGPISRTLLVWNSLLIGTGTMSAGSQAQQSPRPFTVADSIKMTHFEVPDEGAPGDIPVSPDGKKFLIITQRGNLEKNVREYSLLVYASYGAAVLAKAQFNSSSNRPGISDPKWLDDNHISFLAEVPGSVPQVYVLDCQNGKQKQLSSEPNGVLSYAVSPDSRKLLYYPLWTAAPDDRFKEDHGFAITNERLNDLVSGEWRRHSNDLQLRIKDRQNGKILSTERFTVGSRRPPIWLSPDGRYAIVERNPVFVPNVWTGYEDSVVNRLSNEWLNHHAKLAGWGLTELVLVETATGNLRLLTGTPSSVQGHSTVVWSADSRTAIVSSILMPLSVQDPAELATRKVHPVVAEVNVTSGLMQRILPMPRDEYWELAPDSLPDTFRITGWKRSGSELTTRLAPRRFHRDVNKWIEADQLADTKTTPKLSVQQSLNHWPVLVLAAGATKPERIILDPNPLLQTVRFGRPEVVHWTGKKGEALVGGLVYPVGYLPGTRYPLVIQTHGFSPEQFLVDGPFTTALAAQELANKGLAVLQLPQSELELETCDRGPATQSQIESAIDHLDQIGVIDRERVALVGFSITGFNVRNALANSSYKFSAATAAEGNSWSYWSYVLWGNSADWASQDECPFGGPPWNENWNRWMEKSITFNYQKIHTPMRLESDSNDGAEVINEWENFIALKRLGKPVDLIYISHGDHPVVKPWDRVTSQQGNVDWLVFWLKGEEDPDPAKADQYSRWHELKKLQDEQNRKMLTAN